MARTRDTIQAETDIPPNGNPADKRKRKRLTVYLNADGSPDWDGVTDEQRQQFGMGATAAAPPPEPMHVPPEMVGYLVMTMARIEAAIVAPRMGLTAEETARALTPPEPILVGIQEAGARVLAKYAGTMGKYQDEIILGSLLITWQAQAFAELRRMKAANESEPPANPPASIEQRESREGVPRPRPTKRPTPIQAEPAAAAAGGIDSEF